MERIFVTGAGGYIGTTNDDFGFDGPGSPAITDIIYDGAL